MKKYSVIVLLILLVTIISGCTVNASANSENDVAFPVFDENSDNTDSDPYGYEIEEVIEPLEEPSVEVRNDYATVSGGANWMYAKVQDGVQGYETVQYRKTYNAKGELLSRLIVPGSENVVETTNTIYASGQTAQAGAYYTASSITRYGVDCAGCGMGADGRGSTSSGIGVGLNEVRQQDGTWQTGVTYEGYYIIATSSSIPLCTVVEVSNHGISGSGITPGVPFKAIVLDRGGAVQGSKIDLFAGSQANPQVTQTPTRTAEVEILSLNARTRVNGVWNCDV